MLSSEGIVQRLSAASTGQGDRLSIVPPPDLSKIADDGAASIDLRLGRWFRALRPSRTSELDLSGLPNKSLSGSSTSHIPQDTGSTKEYFVPFGEKFVLHPRNFVLGITFEWLCIPPDLGGYVTGKSSLGRRGLIIETASGIQPGFTGCLALELSNVGEVPIALLPGMLVCQIFLHKADPPARATKSQFSGRRKPVLGNIKSDPVLTKLSQHRG